MASSSLSSLSTLAFNNDNDIPLDTPISPTMTVVLGTGTVNLDNQCRSCFMVDESLVHLTVCHKCGFVVCNACITAWYCVTCQKPLCNNCKYSCYRAELSSSSSTTVVKTTTIDTRRRSSDVVVVESPTVHAEKKSKTENTIKPLPKRFNELTAIPDSEKVALLSKAELKQLWCETVMACSIVDFKHIDAPDGFYDLRQYYWKITGVDGMSMTGFALSKESHTEDDWKTKFRTGATFLNTLHHVTGYSPKTWHLDFRHADAHYMKHVIQTKDVKPGNRGPFIHREQNLIFVLLTWFDRGNYTQTTAALFDLSKLHRPW